MYKIKIKIEQFATIANRTKTPDFRGVTSEIYLNFQKIPETGEKLNAIHTHFNSPPVDKAELYEYEKIEDTHLFFSDMGLGWLVYSTNLEFIDMKTDFSEEENHEIYYACEGIRGFLSTKFSKEAIGSTTTAEFEGASKIANDVAPISQIHSLIREHKWEELFTSERWLTLLDAASNMSLLQNNVLNGPFKVLLEYFPEKTKMRLVVA